MSDPIYLPEVTLKPYLRWNELVISNPYNGVATLTAAAEVLDFIKDTEIIKAKNRTPQFDVAITFDANNPKHLQLYALMEEIVREAYEETIPIVVTP